MYSSLEISPATDKSSAGVELVSLLRPPGKVKLAYLLSRYPACSHTFILNEILGLRQLGFEIVTASINPSDRHTSELEPQEQTEEANTFYVKKAGIWKAVKALLRSAILHPSGVLRGFYFTLQLSGGALKFFYFIEALMVGMWMRDHHRSHIHAHFGGPVASVAMIVAHTFPTTMSFTVHGPDEFYNVNQFYLSKKIETASFVCCISAFARSQLMLLSPSATWDKLIVSRLGVDPMKFAARQRMRHGSAPQEIICVGRLVGVKGQHVLIAAVKQLLEEGKNIRLRLVGDGPERPSLEALTIFLGIKDQVIFEGAVGSHRVREFLQAADIFALPSFAEGIPIALMEAMSMEIPCVSTTVAGIPELIRNEIDGLLVAPSDHVQLAAALSRLVNDQDLCRSLGLSGRLRVQEMYDLQQSVQKLGEVFQCRL